MLYEFGTCSLDTEKRLFARDSQAVALAPKTFDLLVLLVESGGRALSKAELMQTLWPDTFVEEANLSYQISTLRKTLGEDGAKWIETVPKYGYRFAGAATLRDAAAVTARETPPPAEKKRSLLYPVGALAATAVIAVMVLTMRTDPAPKRSGPHNPQPLTSHPGLQQHPSLSPDGSQVAYSWDGPNEDNFDIYVKLVGPGEPVRLTTNTASDLAPAWSPDGRQIAFIRFASTFHGTIFLMPALGGAERKLADIVIPGRVHLSWTPDGHYIAFGGRLNEKGGSGIWLIPVDGTSQTRRLTAVGDSTPLDFNPAFSPDGRSLAFIRASVSASGDLYVQRLREDLTPFGEPVPVTSDHVRIESAAWVNDRKLIYCTGGADELRRLKTIEIDAHGRPVHPPQWAGFGDGAQSVSVSRNGTLVYGRQERDVNLWRMEVSGAEARTEKVAASRYQSWTPAWSHDGRKIAFQSTRSGMGEIWVADADGSRPIQVTHMGGNPRWSQDDRVILFNAWKPHSNLYTVDVADGSVAQLTHGDADLVEASWSRDGKWIYCGSNPFSDRPEVYRVPASGGAPVPITKNGGVHAEESNDGKWLYYSKNADSPTAIWRVPRNGGEEAPVVDGLSSSINFAVTDKGIYFISGRMARNSNAIEFFEFATGTRTVLARLEKAISWGIGLSPDYRSLVYAVIDRAASNLMLVEDYR